MENMDKVLGFIVVIIQVSIISDGNTNIMIIIWLLITNKFSCILNIVIYNIIMVINDHGYAFICRKY